MFTDWHCFVLIYFINGNPLQYSCLENLMGRGAWQSTGSQRVRHNWACTHWLYPWGQVLSYCYVTYCFMYVLSLGLLCTHPFYMFTLRKLPTLIILYFLQAQHNFLWQQKWMCFSFLVWKALILKNYSSSCCLFGEYLQHSPHLQTEITGPSSKLSLL